MNNNKEFYNLKELTPIVNLQYKQLKNRVQEINKKYDDSKLIFKKQNKWFIHKTIIKEFSRKRKLIDFNFFITISPEGFYPFSYLLKLVKHINKLIRKESPLERLKFVFERKGKRNHIHILTTFNKKQRIRQIINEHIISETTLNIHYERLYTRYRIDYLEKTYMKKENKPILLRC